jgi:Tfp pilus assembly protein PilO
MNKHKNKTFATILWILCAVVLSLGSIFTYFIYSINSETATLITDTADSSKKSQQLASVRTALRENSATQREIDSVFVAEDSVSSFIDSLESLAVKKSVSISLGSINIEPITGMTGIKQLRIRASSSGSWRDIMSFSASLESLPKAVSVQSLSINKEVAPKDGAEASISWNATFDISVLVLSHETL